MPQPGGWNRFMIEVTDLAATVAELRGNGVRFRNDIVTGVGGKQILAEDPSGNPVELFEPTGTGGQAPAAVLKNFWRGCRSGRRAFVARVERRPAAGHVPEGTRP